MDKNYIEYYYNKLLQAIIFSDNPSKYFNKSVLTGSFISKLNEFVDWCYEYSILDIRMKNNLLEVINYIRFNSNIKKEELYAVCNDLIRNINNSEISYFFWSEFLFEEYEDRKIYNKTWLDFTDDVQIKGLLYSLELDYTVLKSFVCDIEKYEKEIAQELKLNEYYYMSLSKMLKDNKNIFNYEQTWDRIATIHKTNQKLKNNIIKEQRKDYKALIKVSKNFIKKKI